MGKFLVIFNGAAGESDKAALSESRQTEFINAWVAWAASNDGALLGSGAPLNAKKRLTSDGVEEFRGTKTGYSLVQANSHDEAVQMLAQHPHLGLFAGNSIEVLECPPPPS